jgi:hypothetical protein
MAVTIADPGSGWIACSFLTEFEFLSYFSN